MCTSHFHMVSKAGLETPSPHKERRQAQHGLPMASTPPRVQIPLHPTFPCISQLSFAPPVLTVPLLSQGATGHPWDPPVPTAEQSASWKRGFYSYCLCFSLSRLLMTFSTQNFPVINIPTHGRKPAFLILLLCFSKSCFQHLALLAPAPIFFLPAPLRYFRHATKSAAAQRA